MLETGASVFGGTLSRLQRQASSGIVSPGSSGRSRRSLIGGPLALCRKRPGKVEEAAAHGGIINRIIGIDQFNGLAPAQRIGVERLDRRLGEAARGPRR